MLTLLRSGLVAAALALFGQAAVAQSPFGHPAYLTFELDAVEEGSAAYLACIADRTCDRATRLPNGNMIARQVYNDVRSGQLAPHRGALDVYFYVYRSSGQGTDRIYVEDGQGVRVVHATRGCTNVTNIPELGGTPEYCFHLRGYANLKIAFPREFFVAGSTSAAWCAPEMKNGIRPHPAEGIPYVKEELNAKLAGKGLPHKAVTFMLVRGAGSAAPVAAAPSYGYQPQPGYAAYRQPPSGYTPPPTEFGRQLYRH